MVIVTNVHVAVALQCKPLGAIMHVKPYVSVDPSSSAAVRCVDNFEVVACY